MLLDRSAYVEEVAKRNRAWLEQQRAQEATSKLIYDPNEWMTYTEAATFWGVKYMVALRRSQVRQMPLQHVGRQVLVQRAAVEAYRSRAPVSTSHPAIK